MPKNRSLIDKKWICVYRSRLGYAPRLRWAYRNKKGGAVGRHQTTRKNIAGLQLDLGRTRVWIYWRRFP